MVWGGGGSMIFNLLQLLYLINKKQTKSLTHTHILRFLFGVPTLHFYAKCLMKNQVWETLK
jgi:hypothetical protein